MTFPRYFILTLIVMLAIPLLTACSTLAMVEHGAVMAVDSYCSVSASKRKLIRTAVASRLEPNSIQINCSAQ
jgi:hypothetical protein